MTVTVVALCQLKVSITEHLFKFQWFGNLVTPAWWDELWLKEGFASYMEYLGVDHVHADWNMVQFWITSGAIKISDKKYSCVT